MRADELFPTDRPVPERMIGRSEDVARLGRLLEEGLHQLVVGPRREGKTTVCQAAMMQVAATGRYVVAVDLFGIPNLVRLAESIVEKLLANRSMIRRTGRAVSKKTAATATAAAAGLSIHLGSALGADVEVAFEPGRGRRDPWRYFEHALRLLQRMAEHDGVDVVLFVDEFQEIGAVRQPFGDADEVMNLMRSVLQDSPRVTCVFAGSIEHMMRDLLGASHRAFHRWGAWFDLAPIEPATWRSGLQERYASAGLEVEPTALSALVAEGEGHARTTMLLAQQAYLAASSEDAAVLDAELVAVAVVLALRAESAAHEALADQIRDLGRLSLDVAIRVADGDPPYGAGQARAVQRAIGRLEAKGLIEQRGARGRGGWVIVDPLLRRYLRRLGT